jgi:hypothetical protein
MKNIDISLRLGWFVRSNTRKITNIGEEIFEKSRKSKAIAGFQTPIFE